MAVRSLFSIFLNFDVPDGWGISPYRCPGSLQVFSRSLAQYSGPQSPKQWDAPDPRRLRGGLSREPFEAPLVNFGLSDLDLELAPAPRHPGKCPASLWEVLEQLYTPI